MKTSELSFARQTWTDELDLGLSDDELKALHETDKEVIFDALCNFLSETEKIKIVESKNDLGEDLASSAAFLVPHTRVFIRADASVLNWVKRLTKFVVLWSMVGIKDPKSAIAALSIDLVFGLFDRISLLKDQDTDIVNAILYLRNANSISLPTSSEIAQVVGLNITEINHHLSSLENASVLRREDSGWDVVF